MTKDVVTLHANDNIQHALDKFKEMNLMKPAGGYAEGKLVGTLAMYQVVEWFKRCLQMCAAAGNIRSKQIMTRKVVTVQPLQDRLQDLVPYFCGTFF